MLKTSWRKMEYRRKVTGKMIVTTVCADVVSRKRQEKEEEENKDKPLEMKSHRF
jgi:hypothetical protein